LIRIILPDRVNDFKRYYYQKGEKCLENFITSYSDFDVFLEDSIKNAIILFQCQLGIVKSAQRRFESSLFDIQKIVRADLFDSEIDAARKLLKNGFLRAAGALAGVVLEKHLEQVCFKNMRSKKSQSSWL